MHTSRGRWHALAGGVYAGRGNLVRGVCMPGKVEGQPALAVLGIGWKVPARPVHPRACPPAPLEPLGADAFLPALTEELIWSPDIGETQLDVEFLMELLDPDELRGEGDAPAPERRDPRGGALGRPPAAGGKAVNLQGACRRPGNLRGLR